jgi:D-alanine-D-alanine ligase
VSRAGNTARLTVCDSITDLDAVVARGPDFVLLVAKYIFIQSAENIWFSDYFLQNEITFSGSDRETLKFDCDKVLAKIHLRNMGIKTARNFMTLPEQFLSQNRLPLHFPLFIKSTDTINSNGIDNFSLVNTFVEFEAKVLSIFIAEKRPALVEEYLPGREFSIAIICNAHGDMTMFSVEMLPSKHSNEAGVHGSSVKRQDIDCHTKIADPGDNQRVNEFAKKLFLGLGLRGFGRIDVKMNKHGQFFFMKAKLVPHITCDKSYFSKIFEIANNLSYDQVICLMLEECANRAKLDKELNQEINKGINRGINKEPNKKIARRLIKQNQHWPKALVKKVYNKKYKY